MVMIRFVLSKKIVKRRRRKITQFFVRHLWLLPYMSLQKIKIKIKIKINK
jgi:hypothetical protein